jgi:integrase
VNGTTTPRVKRKRVKTNRAKTLSVRMVAQARPGSVLWDKRTIGLALLTTPKGKKSWCLNLRYPGAASQAMRRIGTYPALGLAEARQKAVEWHALVRAGRDPHEEARAAGRLAATARAAEAMRDAQTFGAIGERFIAAKTNRRKIADAREIRRQLIKAWGERPIHAITAADVRPLFERLGAATPFEARNAFGHATQIFKWAVHQELLDASPLASLNKRLLFARGTIKPRERVLSDDELRTFWRATRRLGYPYSDFYRLVLLLGVRVQELARARWSEFAPQLRTALRDGNWAALPAEARVWTIPEARFKSEVTHTVPLSDAALEILAGLPRWSGDYLFSHSSGRTPVNNLSGAKTRLDAAMLRTMKAMARMRGEDPRSVTLENFVIHDLRRVVRSHLSAMDVADHIAEMALGQGRKGLARVYDRHRYESQIREALARWATRLAVIAAPTPTPDNVVAWRGRAS